MDVDEAIAQLAPVYARALKLRGFGLSTAQLAEALDIPEQAVGGVLEIATVKLANLASRRDGGQSE